MRSHARAFALYIAVTVCPAATAHQPEHASEAPVQTSTTTAKGASSPAAEYFTDVALVDQHGNPRRLYSDLLQGKVVVISSFFTHCEESCPIVAGKFAALQSALGDRLGTSVHLMLLTTDPSRDTPAVLHDYAQKFKARPGWYFLTGEKENVDLALHRFGHYTTEPQAHNNVIIVGNEATGLWKKAVAILSPRDLQHLVEAALADQAR